jgi:beta-N-acetylhexosaminidase
MALEQKIGQMFIVGFEAPYVDEHVTKVIKEYHLGNIIYFSRNIKSSRQLFEMNKELQRMAMSENNIPLFISIDQEGGMVTRIPKGATFFPGNMALSAGGTSEDAYIQGCYCGEELEALGINMNLAPVLDVNNNLDNPVIGVRSYGENPSRVADLGTSYIKGLQKSGVIATGKHFPGHGDTSTDSHLDLSSVPHDKKRLDEVELYPFKKAIENGVNAIMSAHVVFPAYEKENLPATLSKKVLTELLRNELGFNGLILTDCMEMKAIDNYFGTEKAAVMAVEAGADLICISHSLDKQVNAYNNLLDAVKSGRISEERIDESVSRIIGFKNKIQVDKFLKSGFEEVEAIINNETHKEFAQRISEQSITLVKNEQMLPLKNTEKILMVSTNAVSTTGADDSLPERSIAKVIVKSFENFHNEVIDIQPTALQAEHIKKISGNFDKVVVFTYNAHLYKQQSELVSKIYEVNKNLIVISMRNPYDIKAFNYVPCYVAAYEYTPISLNSLIKFLKGDIKGSGKLPVSL